MFWLFRIFVTVGKQAATWWQMAKFRGTRVKGQKSEDNWEITVSDRKKLWILTRKERWGTFLD